MLFYFVRHGETDANKAQILAGSGLDVPLNERGHAQARALAQDLAKRIGHPVARIIASDMIRTRETARYLGTSLNLPVEVDADWREWLLGSWEGKPFVEYAEKFLGDAEPEGGELRREFNSRVERAWKTHHRENEPYIVVSHGGVWMALQDHLSIPRFRIGNCQIIRLERVDGKWLATLLKD